MFNIIYNKIILILKNITKLYRKLKMFINEYVYYENILNITFNI